MESLKIGFLFLLLSALITGLKFTDAYEVDIVLLESSKNLIKQKWNECDLSQSIENELIFCQYVAYFDTLTFTKQNFNDNTLRKHFTFLKGSLNCTNSTIYFYECNCEIYDSSSTFIASIDTQQDFIIFPVFKTEFEKKPILKTRFLLKDQFVLIPLSKKQTFNFKWRLSIGASGNFLWFKTDEPKRTYTTEEVRSNYLDDFIIS